MATRQGLTLQQVLNKIFMDPLTEDNEEDHLEENYSDSVKDSLERDEEVPNKVTDTCNEPVPSTSNQSFGYHRTDHAGLRGGRGRVPGSFALLSFRHF